VALAHYNYPSRCACAACVCVSALECSFFLRFDEEERLAVLFIGDDDGWWMGGGGPNKTREKKVYAVSCLFFFAAYLTISLLTSSPTMHATETYRLPSLFDSNQ
jgi:hypothetical protein